MASQRHQQKITLGQIRRRCVLTHARLNLRPLRPVRPELLPLRPVRPELLPLRPLHSVRPELPPLHPVRPELPGNARSNSMRSEFPRNAGSHPMPPGCAASFFGSGWQVASYPRPEYLQAPARSSYFHLLMDAGYYRVFVASAGIGISSTFVFKSCLRRSGHILLIIRACSLWIC